ncbi:MAG: GNAT family N-acetyltransferase [Phycisphaerae bacterium]|jgi:putative acetyltransferase|nr:GNAT family N-acetyltransferase [Phycisphaerae bacterium]MBT6269512.1 GNAT family N-acetyltransferase [Phycisphaerae bacterium]MBT6283485.1 GNAT family N-acetyltransferase [Phycisphaerae bacterium]
MHESNQQAQFESDELVIRDANSEDISVLRELFEKSRIEGLIRENDTGADLDFLMASYFECKDSGFWVAQHDDGIIGMIGVQRVSENSAEIRRLRVRDSFRRKGIGTKLMSHAIAFCKEKQFLKVVLDVRAERSPAITLFDSFGFSHVGENTVGGRAIIDFYLDLYSDKTETLH